MASPAFQIGDLVVYQRTEFGPHPGPDASQVAPSRNGDSYTYCVTKYWIVQEVLPNAQLRVTTREGHQHLIDARDANLRRANFLERFWIKRQFERPEASGGPRQREIA